MSTSLCRHLHAASILGADVSRVKEADAGKVLSDVILKYMERLKVCARECPTSFPFLFHAPTRVFPRSSCSAAPPHVAGCSPFHCTHLYVRSPMGWLPLVTRRQTLTVSGHALATNPLKRKSQACLLPPPPCPCPASPPPHPHTRMVYWIRQTAMVQGTLPQKRVLAVAPRTSTGDDLHKLFEDSFRVYK
jgi:hypothetical protein